MDRTGQIDVLAHMRLLAETRLQSLQASLFHLEDSLPILVAEYTMLIEQHKAAIRYEEEHLERLGVHAAGGSFVAPGALPRVEGVPLPPFAPPEGLPPEPPPGMVEMTAQPGVQAQSHVLPRLKDPALAARTSAAVPIPQSKVQAVFYEKGEPRPPEAITGHMTDPPRSAEELLAERDANRIAAASKEQAPADVNSSPALPTSGN